MAIFQWISNGSVTKLHELYSIIPQYDILIPVSMHVNKDDLYVKLSKE